MKLTSLKIISSQTGAAILNLFFDDPQREYYLRQIEKITGYSVGNIRREIIKLESEGLFLTRPIGKIKLYRLNTDYPLYEEIKNIVRKTIGIEGALKNLLSKCRNVDFAFIYGSLAEGKEKTSSDVDIVVIGDVNTREIKSLFFDYQSKISREVNSIVYSRKEFLNKLKEKNHFVFAIVKQKKIFIRGDEDEFRRFIQIWKT